MSVRREMRLDPVTGARRQFWMIDVDMELPDGRRKRIRKVSPIQSRRGAEEFEIELRRSLLSGTHGKEVERLRFTEFASKFMSQHLNPSNKPSEIRGKEIILRRHLVPNLGKCWLDEIDETVIRNFKRKQLTAGLSMKSINNQLILLRTILGRSHELKLIERIPKVEKFRISEPKIEFLTDDEISRLYTSASSEPEWRAAIALAANCGLRLGELIGLKWSDIDLIDGKLWVQRSDWQGIIGTPKSGKARFIPLNGTAVAALKAHRHLRGEWVFCKDDGSRRGKDDFKISLRRMRKRAGLRDFEWHLLRHSFASHLVKRRVPMRTVQLLLGHSSISMTMRYAHVADDDLDRAVASLDTQSDKLRQPDGNKEKAEVVSFG